MDAQSQPSGIKLGISAILGVFVQVNYKVAIALFLLMILDVIIGILFAMINGEFVSQEMKVGIVIKALIFLLALSLLIFLDVARDYGIEIPFANSFGILFCFNEMFSIIETFAKNEILIPRPITKWFKVTNDEINKEG